MKKVMTNKVVLLLASMLVIIIFNFSSSPSTAEGKLAACRGQLKTALTPVKPTIIYKIKDCPTHEPIKIQPPVANCERATYNSVVRGTTPAN